MWVKHMEYSILAIVVMAGLLGWNEITSLRKRITSLEERLNQLAKRTNHEDISSDWVSDEVKELVMNLKQAGKEVEAVKTIRDHTQMSLIDAKQYVDKLGQED